MEDDAERGVHCMWWCHEAGPGILFHTTSTQNVNALLAAIGRHVGMKLYLIDHVTASPASLHVILSTRETGVSVDQVSVAIDYAMNPSMPISKDNLGILQHLGLLTSEGLGTAFPTLYTLDFESLYAEDATPVKPIEEMTPEERFRADEHALATPKTVLLRFVNTAPKSQISWLGAYCGSERACGKRSTANNMIAEIGRQLNKMFYTVNSISVTPHEVSLVCNYVDQNSEKLHWLFNLVQYGGQPLSAESLQGCREAGLY